MGKARQGVERAFELFNAQDVDGLRKTCTDNCEATIPGVGVVKGPEGVANAWAAYFKAFPDGQLTAHSWVEETDAAVCEHTFVGTHTGPLVGPQGEIPSTGRKVTLEAIVLYRFEGDRTSAIHLYYDQVPFLTQLGLLPGPEGV